MKHVGRNIVIGLMCFYVSIILSRTLNDRIKIVCTSALTPTHYETREQQYKYALSLLKEKHKLDFYLVESIASGPTFLDEYCDHVLYTRSNNASILNHGVNEAVSLRIAFEEFNFDPETIIIKLTGRYTLESDEFIRLVEKNLDADVIARVWSDGATHTGLFAMRLKYWLDFLDNFIPYQEMIEKMTPVEHCIGRYIAKIKKEGAKIIYLPRMYSYIHIPYPFCLSNH